MSDVALGALGRPVTGERDDALVSRRPSTVAGAPEHLRFAPPLAPVEHGGEDLPPPVRTAAVIPDRTHGAIRVAGQPRPLAHRVRIRRDSHRGRPALATVAGPDRK